ncbi:hypothetical protein GSI_02209 [Ganoderma sinense ZZ0214-1]|uniref:Uncharacterized protein n=1 Tax=Ganoderma sinense ZZ0214-1 TaxID=1077348 RepID=A0A2G8SNZ2_9APHY|nr:hypothetical protein GSI_02209 [Ganoderma sinense ZZ0214-1]
MDSKSKTAILLLAFSLSNLLYILWFWRHLSRYEVGLPEAFSYRAHDYPEYLPVTLEDVFVTIEETSHYLPLGEESEAALVSMVPAGSGYIRLGPEDRTFVVTMFHELHCLRMMNRAFSKSPTVTLDHLKHCLNYIRQGILCSPDLTLEPGDFEERDFEVERTSGTHVCKNWDAIYNVMEEHYYSWSNRTGYGS